jgi:hypothetical protein
MRRFRRHLSAVLGISFIASGAAFGQTATQLELTREVVQTERKALVAANLELGEKDADAFWPVYNKYQEKLREVNDRRARLVQRFLQDYEVLTEDQARAMINEWLSIQKDRVGLKRSYARRFRKVLGAKRALRFYQIDNKLDAIIDIELAAAIPLAR